MTAESMTDLHQTRDTLFTGVAATKYSTVASLAFLLYDHGLTFPAEVAFIWNSRWSFGKALFLLNRYFTPFTLILSVIVFFSHSLTNEFCYAFFWWEAIGVVMANLGAEIILQTRVYAVFGRNKKVLVTMVVLCVLEKASTFILLGRRDFGGFKIVLLDGLTGCYAAGLPRSYFSIWFPVLVFETILCFFMLFKAWKIYREGLGFPLFNLIVRDSVLYFFTIFAVLLVNFFVWALAPQVLIQVALGWTLAVPCAVGSRLLLNIRERCFKEDLDTLGQPTRLELHMVRRVPIYATPERSSRYLVLDRG